MSRNSRRPRPKRSKVVDAKASGYAIIGDPRPAVTAYISQHKITEGTYPSLSVLIKDIVEPGRNLWFDRAGCRSSRSATFETTCI